MYFCPLAVSLLLTASLFAQGQASNLAAVHRDGQTFLTWAEATTPTVPDEYNVYRKAAAIQAPADLAGATLVATVKKGSYWNVRANRAFVLKDQTLELPAGTGFLVTTPALSGTSYYAVCARTNSVENTAINPAVGGNSVGPVNETVALPQAVLQLVADGGKELHYVHFLPAVTNAAVRAQTNREGRALNFRIWHDPLSSGPRPVILMLHARGSSYATPKSLPWLPANALQVFLDDDNDPFLHSVWFGYHDKYPQGPATGMVLDYTERRILWTLDQVLKSGLLPDKNRVYCFGASYGAMGALAMGTRYANLFAAAGGTVPAFGFTHQDFALTQDTDTLFGTVAQNLPTNLGPRFYDLFDYTSQMAALDVAGAAPMVFTAGRADAVTGWTEKPAFFRAALTARQPLGLYWDYRSHTTPGPWTNIEDKLFSELFAIRLDRPVPAFANLTLDDNPGDGNRFDGDLTGCMSGYATFDPVTAAETTAKVTLDVGLKEDSTRLDYAKQPVAYASMAVRRLKLFTVQAGSYYKLTARKRNQTPIEEERILVADAKGRLAVTKLQLERGFRTVEIERYTPVELPEVHFGGTTAIGGTLVLTHLAAGNQFFMWCVGSIETSIPTPYGIWRILDPLFVTGGVTPTNGLIEVIVNLPNDTRFRGLRMLGQTMVGPKIGPLAKVTLR